MSRRWISHWPKLALALGSTALYAGVGLAARQQEITVLEPQQEGIIHYLDNRDLSDPIAQLKSKIEHGRKKLAYDDEHGYLRALLKEFNIPVSSQCLVFSKTSQLTSLISPKTPRAIYFNDSVYVAFVQGSNHLEIATVDPNKGAVFYALDQKPGGKPAITRRLECVRCHFGPKTVGVPGLVVRSSLTKPDGVATSQVLEFVSGHNSPISMRWAGWYVTGLSENDVHMGNSFLQDPLHPEKFDPKPGSNITSITDRFDTTKYLAPTSDIVALMLLDDSVRMHDIIIHAGYEARFAEADRKRGDFAPGWPEKRIANAGELLLTHMLFRDESPLKGELKPTSSIMQDFQKPGPRDKKGRSLRELDMKSKMFRYPCSYLIYSREFDAMPKEMKLYVWRRLDEILDGRDRTGRFRSITATDRQAVREILLDTKPEFRDWCKSNATS